jgi:hypothetical protein
MDTIVNEPKSDYFATKPWREIRSQVFKRDHYDCQACLKRFPAKELQAHHINPKNKGGTATLTNLITLCSPCHDYVELEGLSSKSSITACRCDPINVIPVLADGELDDSRPNWHKYVYGGCKIDFISSNGVI